MQRHMHTRYGGSRLMLGLFLALAACADQPTAPVAELNEVSAPQFDLGPGQIIVVMEDLGPKLSSSSSFANAINSSQQITGWRHVQGAQDAYVWEPPGNVKTLGTIGQAPYTSIGYDINDAGVIVGQAGAYAFRWTPPGPMEQLGSHASSILDAAYAVNNGGTAAGVINSGMDWLVYWNAGDTSYIQPKHPGPAPIKGMPLNGEAKDINNSLEMVGDYVGVQAFYWRAFPNVLTVLADLPGSIGSAANAINEAGVIVGSSTVGGEHRAVRWPSHMSPAQDLGTLGGSWSIATDINQAGVIVGSSSTASGAMRAFRLDPNGVPQNLGAPNGAIATVARGISEQGHIVGAASFPNVGNHAIVWWNFTSKSVMAVDTDFPALVMSSSQYSVALLSSDGVDALQIDAGTLTLGDNVGEDVRVLTSAEGTLQAVERDVNRDGRMDLVVSFPCRQLVAQEVPAGVDRADLVLKGALLDRRMGVYATAVVTVER